MTTDVPIPALTPRQARFVDEYLIDLNATQAAIRAGYSARTANQQGPRLLESSTVMAAIDARKIDRSEKLKIDAGWILQRLVAEAEADLADLYDQYNNLKAVEDWPLIWRQGLVQGIEVEALFDGFGKDREQIGTVRKIKLDNRVKRIELIGKHIKVNAFQEQVVVSGLDGLAERLDRAMRAHPVAPVIIDAPLRHRAPERASMALPAAPAPITAPDAPPATPPAECTAPAAPPSEPPPPTAPPPKPHRPIMPDPAPVSWPLICGHAATDYDSDDI